MVLRNVRNVIGAANMNDKEPTKLVDERWNKIIESAESLKEKLDIKEAD